MSGMVVAPQPLAVEEGVKALRAGGNAVDAAVTTAFVQGILDPHSCGIGGYVLANLHITGGPWPGILDAPAVAGARATPDMWVSEYLRPNPGGWGYFLRDKVNDMGYQAMCTPGAVKGLAAMLERWGTISWEQAIAPAVRIAEEGFVVESHLAAGWQTHASCPEESSLLDYIEGNAEARRVYLRDGRPPATGDLFRNPDLGGTLRRLAADGPEDFYRGRLAGEIAADLEANGSFVTAEDLAGYQLRDEAAVRGTYRGYGVATSQPPHGGPTLLAILNILDGYDLGGMEHNSPGYIRLLALAMKAAFADRNPYMADPRFVDVPLEWMVSKERAAYWRDRIDAGQPIEVSFAAAGSPDTTHVSVVDGKGNSVALTHSLGSSSGVITPGMGFMYNNSMVNFHPLPGHPNSIAPGKGRTTGMSPTIVYSGNKPMLVIGAPGATRIITSMVQVIVNVIDFGMSIEEAVLAPRIDCQGDVIRCQARIPEYACAEVRLSHAIERLPRSHGGLALVHAIHIDPASGRTTGAADAGAGGMALRA